MIDRNSMGMTYDDCIRASLENIADGGGTVADHVALIVRDFGPEAGQRAERDIVLQQWADVASADIANAVNTGDLDYAASYWGQDAGADCIDAAMRALGHDHDALLDSPGEAGYQRAWDEAADALEKRMPIAPHDYDAFLGGEA